MSSIAVIIGKNVRRFRKGKKLTQEELARMVNVSGSYIGYLERGIQIPSLKLLEKMALSLEVELALLLTNPDNTRTQELNTLISLLSEKSPEAIKFLNDVAIAYFKSIEGKNSLNIEQ